ncbi:FAD-dependent oxidoreductase [Marinobacter sp. TBZ242]|uniref:FAD-dependent oxidoreductase n=1 Tax=Marinobacter azerbaijanicus TaxID=3050455 RepID=A0ABT7IIN8_9GAMM|nr:FAD-dependent oxidoreductase [Marinobacter sp. TBZ242]MDL0432959.1 FAD-dependent oxidoreductase [Marinobacter sp. TBZ242]
MKTWLCVVCGLIYDEAKGWPKDGIAPGTRWEDVPDDWLCPDCGVGKADFEMLEITCDMPETPVALLAAEAESASMPSGMVPEGPVVIIGSGHAGYGLAKALRSLNADREIHVFTADDGGRYSKPALSNALAMKKDAHSLLEESALAIERRLEIRVHAFCPVLSIDTRQQTLVTRLGDMSYGQLILATGARPIRIGFTGDQSALLAVNDRQDYQRMRAKLDCLDEPARVTIIGDGLIGCEFANDLAQAGHAVNVVGLADRPLPRLLPAAGSEVLRRGLSEIGVQWYLSRSLADVKSAPDGSYRLTLTDGTTLDSDLLISAVGLSPNISLAQEAGVKCGRGIQVNDYLATSIPNIYALGDAVELNGQLLPYLAPINAGIKALALTIDGTPTPVDYPVMPVMVKTPAAPVCVVVPPSEVAVQWRVDRIGDGVRIQCHDDDGVMLGFALVGKEAMSSRSDWIKACGKATEELV